MPHEILQGEKETLSTVEYLGTVSAINSILVYLTTDEDYVLIPVDTDNISPQFAKIFSKLKSKENIQIKIAGGSSESLSHSYLRSIIQALKVLADDNNVAITITEQYLWQKSSAEDKNYFLFDLLLPLIELVYQKRFGAAFDRTKLGRLAAKPFQQNEDELEEDVESEEDTESEEENDDTLSKNESEHEEEENDAQSENDTESEDSLKGKLKKFLKLLLTKGLYAPDSKYARQANAIAPQEDF